MEEVNDYPFEYWKYTQEPIKSSEGGSFEEVEKRESGEVAVTEERKNRNGQR